MANEHLRHTMRNEVLASGLVEYLEAKGFSGWPRCQRLTGKVIHEISLDEERTWRRDAIRFDLILCVYSEEIYRASSPPRPESWPMISMVTASLFQMITGEKGMGWPIRSDDHGDHTSVLKLMIAGLERVGLPFLDRIQNSGDVIQVMTTTEFSGFDSEFTQRIVEGYRSKHP